MNVKQALKERNRLAKEIKGLYAIAQTNNSIEKGNERRYNVADALAQAAELTEQLVELKTKTHLANTPVFDKIFKLSELKSTIVNIKSVDCTEGKQSSRWDRGEVNFKEVEMNVLEKDQLVKKLEKEVNDLQDQLDYHNSVTEI